MSLLINGDLIWVSVPKCASFSIETSLEESDLQIDLLENYSLLKKLPKSDPKNFLYSHAHYTLIDCYAEFGIKDTICINRDYAERWISGLKQIWYELEVSGFVLKFKWESLTNDWIYDFFTNDIIRDINTCNGDNLMEFLKKLVLNKDYHIDLVNFKLLWFCLVSQNFWKFNKPCTYEFNINELDKFKNFIENRYGTTITIKKLNSTEDSNYGKNKIFLDEKLRNWIWDNFEKPFIKTNNLI